MLFPIIILCITQLANCAPHPQEQPGLATASFPSLQPDRSITWRNPTRADPSRNWRNRFMRRATRAGSHGPSVPASCVSPGSRPPACRLPRLTTHPTRAEGARIVFVRLMIQEAGEEFRATLSQRDDESKAPVNEPETFVVKTKDEAKRRARAMARELGLATFRVIDKAQ